MKNRKLKFLLLSGAFSILLLYSTILYGDRTTSVTLPQANSQQLDQNKINYLTNKGGYLKKMAVTNSALAREAIKRGVVKFSNGTPKDLDTDQSYNEQVTYKRNRTRDYNSDNLNITGDGYDTSTEVYDESGHLISDGESDRIATANTLGIYGNASQADIVAAETLYLKKEAAYNALLAAYNAASTAEQEAFPEWDTAQKLKDAMNAEYNLALALDNLNTDRDELQDTLNNISYLVDDPDFDAQDEITSEIASDYEETSRLGLVNAYALAAATAVEEWNDAKAAEATALSNKEAAETAVTESQTARDDAVTEYNNAVDAEETARLADIAATKLAAKNTADTNVSSSASTLSSAQESYLELFPDDTNFSNADNIEEGSPGYEEAQAYITANTTHSSNLSAQSTATGEYNTAASNYATDLGKGSLTEADEAYISNAATVASDYSTAQETTAAELDDKNAAQATYDANHSDLVEAQSSATDVYTESHETTTEKNTAKNSAVSDYNSNRSSSESYMSTSSTTDNANNIYSAVNSSYTDTVYYDKVSGVTDVSTLASNYSDAQNLTQKTSDRNSSQSTYNGNKTTYNKLVDEYNTAFDEHSSSIPDSYTPLTAVVEEGDVTATEAAEAAKTAAASSYSTLNSAYQPLLDAKQVEESTYSYAEEEMNTAWAMVEETRGN